MKEQYLKIKDVSIRFPFQEKEVLKKVSFHVSRGEKVLLLGPSGVGKSTLALALNGIIPRSMEAEVSGDILISEESPLNLDLHEISKHVGILFQDPETQFCMLTVEDEIIFGLENLRLSKEEMEDRLERSLEMVGLTPWRKASIKELSGGMKQKLGIACLLAMDSEVFILDEPTANLDPQSTVEIFNILFQISSKLNKTLIFIEHKLDHLLPYLDRVIVFGRHGHIITDGKPREVFNKEFKQIKNEGIWVPNILQEVKKLEEHGMKWDEVPLTLEEWNNYMSHMGVTPRFQSREYRENELKNGSVILETKNLSFSYKDHSVLDCLNFSVQSGDFVALLGPNGTGKSTIAKQLIGLIKPKQGKILLNGVPIHQLTSEELMKSIGYVFQNPEHQFICDTVEQELAYGLKLIGWSKEKWKPRVQELLKDFHLVKQKNQNPFTLSQGQKRRLSVATMLTNHQQILILDEPTFGQDQVNTDSLMKLLKKLNEGGKTVIMITHDMELVYKYAKTVLLLNEGKVAYEGDVNSFFEETAILDHASIKVPLSYELGPWVNAFKEGSVLC